MKTAQSAGRILRRTSRRAKAAQEAELRQIKEALYECSEIIEGLQRLAPESCACDWDNPGLLAGRSDKEVKKIYIALDATDQVVEDAVQWGADMLLTHHPLIFKAIKKVNDGNFITRRLVKLIQADISYYAMHTNFDAAPGCMADMAAARLGLTECEPLDPMGELDMDGDVRAIRCGKKRNVRAARDRSGAGGAGERKHSPSLCPGLRTGIPGKTVSRIAVCPGAGGSTLEEGIRWGAQAFVTGDISHHTGIDAAARGNGRHRRRSLRTGAYVYFLHGRTSKGASGRCRGDSKGGAGWPAVLL